MLNENDTSSVTSPGDHSGRSNSYEISREKYNAARCLMNSGRNEEAAELLLSSSLLYPHARTYGLIGECYLSLGRTAEAVPFLAASSMLNRTVRAPSLLAEAFLALGMHYEALQAAKVALSIEPNNKKALGVVAVAQPIEDKRRKDLFG